jgi:hypothetical protein
MLEAAKFCLIDGVVKNLKWGRGCGRMKYRRKKMRLLSRKRVLVLVLLQVLVINVLPVFLYALSEGTMEGGFAYHDHFRHFSIILPKGWARIPQKALLAKRDELIQLMPSGSDVFKNLIVGFHIEEKDYFQYPYICVFYDEKDLLSFEEIVEEHTDTGMRRTLENLEEESKDILQNAKPGSIYIDVDRRFIYRPFHFEVSGIGEIRALSAICIGNDRYTIIYSYSKATEFDKMRPVFQSIIETFAFDSGYTYRDKMRKEGHFQRILDSKLIPFCAAGIGVFLINYFWRKIRRKSKKKGLNESDEEK